MFGGVMKGKRDSREHEESLRALLDALQSVGIRPSGRDEAKADFQKLRW